MRKFEICYSTHRTGARQVGIGLSFLYSRSPNESNTCLRIRVGPDVVKDPAFLVTRNLEDFVTWVDTSAIRKKVLEYKELRDDYDIYC